MHSLTRYLDRNNALTVTSVAGLLALNAYALNPLAFAVAAGLAFIIALYFARRGSENLALYAFVLAELSPISLHASVAITFIYQILCVSLLLGLSKPLSRLNPIATYKGAVLRLLCFALVPIGLFLLMQYSGAFGFSVTGLLSLSVLLALVVLAGLLVVAQQNVNILTRSET